MYKKGLAKSFFGIAPAQTILKTLIINWHRIIKHLLDTLFADDALSISQIHLQISTHIRYTG